MSTAWCETTFLKFPLEPDGGRFVVRTDGDAILLLLNGAQQLSCSLIQHGALEKVTVRECELATHLSQRDLVCSVSAYLLADSLSLGLVLGGEGTG